MKRKRVRISVFSFISTLVLSHGHYSTCIWIIKYGDYKVLFDNIGTLKMLEAYFKQSSTNKKLLILNNLCFSYKLF